ncbi:hypothetical protein ABID19_004039 [Mesorhizobium robiniae]|uniref:Uncharacterized protein n=1 Tax=Mesorhizobium robiniae TaxID=559315 RepID=A0ABV2GRR9_9HYPH
MIDVATGEGAPGAKPFGVNKLTFSHMFDSAVSPLRLGGVVWWVPVTIACSGCSCVLLFQTKGRGMHVAAGQFTASASV